MKQYNLVQIAQDDDKDYVSTDEINAQVLLGYEVVTPLSVIRDKYVLMVRDFEYDNETILTTTHIS